MLRHRTDYLLLTTGRRVVYLQRERCVVMAVLVRHGGEDESGGIDVVLVDGVVCAHRGTIEGERAHCQRRRESRPIGIAASGSCRDLTSVHHPADMKPGPAPTPAVAVVPLRRGILIPGPEVLGVGSAGCRSCCRSGENRPFVARGAAAHDAAHRGLHRGPPGLLNRGQDHDGGRGDDVARRHRTTGWRSGCLGPGRHVRAWLEWYGSSRGPVTGAGLGRLARDSAPRAPASRESARAPSCGWPPHGPHAGSVLQDEGAPPGGTHAHPEAGQGVVPQDVALGFQGYRRRCAS